MTQSYLPTITGVVLLVPEARDIAPWAHITILAPFGQQPVPTAGELAELEKFFAGEMPFTYELTQICTFPSGMRYLSPEPVGAFSRLTHGLHQLFPEYPPYEGTFDLVIPHLSIPDDAVVESLPIQAHARTATLLHVEDGVHNELASFPFGTSAA